MTDQKIVTQLSRDWLTIPQAKLYYAGLKFGPELMARLAKRAGIRRTTAYYMMQELQRRQFFARRKIGKRTYYIAISLEGLLEMTRQRARLIKKLITELEC